MQATERDLARVAGIADEHRRIFAAMLTSLDDSTGVLLAALREHKLDTNTLVFFLSDNGGPTAELTSGNGPLRGGKGQLYEGGIRVPFFAMWPGCIPAGKVFTAPVSSLDIAATVLAAAGVKDSNGLDGVNLLPHLTGETTAPHDYLAWRFGPQKALRRGQWKLVDWRDFETKQNSGWQLYDLSQDIGEKNNLAAMRPELVAQLSREWDQWNTHNIALLWHGSPTEDPTAPARAVPGKAKGK